MLSSVFSAAVVFATLSAAQTYTSCNPLEKTCPADPALGTSINVDFTKGANSAFSALPGTTMKYGSDAAQFTINTDSDAPTMESNWYIFFGKVDVVMQASPGVGIVSSVVLQSDDLDEIDWEWLGGDAAQVQTNYFGKGDTTTYDRGGFSKVANPQTTYHKYSFDWTAESLKWSIDDVVVRTLNYADAKGGSRYPQTPCRLKLGSWVAGSPKQPKGTQEWAGGLTDFSKAPFVMNIKSISVTDGTTGAAEYVYGDNSGSWQSIKKQGSSSGQTSGIPTSSLIQVTSVAATSVATSAAVTSSAIASASTSAAVSSSVAVSSSTAVVVASSSTNAPSTLVTVGTSSTSLPATAASTTSSPTRAAATSTSATATPTHNAASKPGNGNLVIAGLGLALGYFVM